MRRRLLIAGIVLLLSGCASVPISPSVTAFNVLQLRQRAGLYPADWEVVGSSHARALDRLEAWAARQGILIVPAPIGRKRLLGYVHHTRYLGWLILLNDDLPPNSRLSTLLHELGHIYGPRVTEEDAKEVIAEMVSASVCQRLGLDVWPQTAAYLMAYVPVIERQGAIVQRYGSEIDAVVGKLTAAAQE